MQNRCVAVVIDPIQSVKGKVVIDAFRLINPQTVLAGREPRQTTSNIGHINKPSIQALVHGLNRHYYSIAVNYRKTELEQAMLMNLHKRNWTEGLKLKDFCSHKESNEDAIKVSSDQNFRESRMNCLRRRKCLRYQRRTTNRSKKSRRFLQINSRHVMWGSKILNDIWKKRWKRRSAIRWYRIWARCYWQNCKDGVVLIRMYCQRDHHQDNHGKSTRPDVRVA